MSQFKSLERRSFLKLTAFSLGCGTLGASFERLLAGEQKGKCEGYGPVAPVKDQTTGLPLLSLPNGFNYISYGWVGDEMADGTVTPDEHDGMGVIAEANGLVTLCRNHEVSSSKASFGSEKMTFDANAGGGCTNLQFDMNKKEWTKAWSSLAGTVKNCAGGPTPWNSWLSCEETTFGPGAIDDGEVLDFHQDHGWIFEVPAAGHSSAVPIKEMGRFTHEAVAIDPETGIVYETEDRDIAGFYRYLPKTPGKLAEGGRLEMLRVKGEPDLRTVGETGKKYDCEWVSIEDPLKAHVNDKEQDRHGCYQQGKDQQATTFARLEGCWYGNDLIYFDATSGGPAGAGQIWQYDPKNEQLMLLFASPSNEVLDQPDNLAVSPRGGIILCEDGDLIPQRLHGLTPSGELFTFAKNNVQLKGERNGLQGDFRGSEWCGASFSSSGEWLFVNLQKPGITFAITGPWGEGLL